MIKEAEWHRDGHHIHLHLEGENLYISSVSCPGNGNCSYDDVDCVVKWSTDRFGLSINVGSCPANADLEIAWTLVKGNSRDMDSHQVWIIPTDDFVFSSFFDAQNTPEE